MAYLVHRRIRFRATNSTRENWSGSSQWRVWLVSRTRVRYQLDILHPVLKPSALFSANGPQLATPTDWHTSGTFRLARCVEGFDTSVVTTVLSVGSASAYATRNG